jgi:hypothetical protein
LAKEIMILPILAIALVGGRRFTPRSARWMLVLTPGVAVAGWGLYERWRLGWQATSVQELTWPMHGYVDAYRRGWRPSHDWGNALVALIFLAAGVAITVAWIRRPRDLLLSAALPLAVLTPFLSGQVVGLSPNSSRALAPSVTLAALAAMLPSPQHGREEGAGPPGRPPSI